MCGIAGIFYFGKTNESGPVGHDLLLMSQCLQHRGADSAGVAVFSAPAAKESLQVVLTSGSVLPEPQTIDRLANGLLNNFRQTPDGFTATLTSTTTAGPEISKLITDIESGLPGSVVTSYGKSLQIKKTVGLIEHLVEVIEPLAGTHGISHLRLATESIIDPAHAQPFWGRPFPDIAVTHNGHITNYFKLRQKLEARGFTFASRNDSEIIGILIGEQMASGADLEQALATVIPDLDGSFSFVAAAPSGLGVARDPFATKPLLFVETDELLAIASEQQALRRLLGEDANIQEIQPKEFRTWEKA